MMNWYGLQSIGCYFQYFGLLFRYIRVAWPGINQGRPNRRRTRRTSSRWWSGSVCSLGIRVWYRSAAFVILSLLLDHLWWSQKIVLVGMSVCPSARRSVNISVFFQILFLWNSIQYTWIHLRQLCWNAFTKPWLHTVETRTTLHYEDSFTHISCMEVFIFIKAECYFQYVGLQLWYIIKVWLGKAGVTPAINQGRPYRRRYSGWCWIWVVSQHEYSVCYGSVAKASDPYQTPTLTKLSECNSSWSAMFIRPLTFTDKWIQVGTEVDCAQMFEIASSILHFILPIYV